MNIWTRPPSSLSTSITIGSLSELSSIMLSMESAVSEKNYEDLYRLAHGLKGSSRNYEFFSLGDIFFEVEKAAADKNMDASRYYMRQARNYLDNVQVEFVDKG